MIRSAASKVMWVGRATVFLVGLAVVLGLLFGVAATALAGTGVGATFNLGQANTVDKISSLIGSATSAMLKIDNNGAGPALALQVEPGEQPMTVNSERKVARLNAEKVDGLDSTRFAGTGNSAYRGGSSICGPGGAPFTSTLPVSVGKESLLFATARAGVQANANANASTLMNVELRNADNTTTLASTGFSSQAFSANSTDVRDLVSEGVLKSGVSSPSEARFVLKPGVDYVLRMTVSLNGGTCTGSSPMIWSSSLSYIVLGKP